MAQSKGRKFDRNKLSCARYQAQNRQQINKEKRIAREGKRQIKKRIRWEDRIANHKPARGTARRIRRHGYQPIEVTP